MDSISITDFNGAEDVFDTGVLGTRANLTFDQLAAVQAEDSLFDALLEAQGYVTDGQCTTFVYDGSTYIYNDVAGSPAGTLTGDGLIELTGFTGEFTAQNFIA